MQEIFQMRDDLLKTYHNLDLYPFQKEISNEIIKKVFNNEGGESFIEISRQAGKTEAVVRTVEFLLLVGRAFLNKPLRIGIFAPQHEQAKTDFDRLKEALESKPLADEFELTFPESNANTLNVFQSGENYGFCYIFPITKTSHPESKTLDLIIYEEAQHIDGVLKANKTDPMGASTNASRVNFGSAGYQINYFYRGIQKGTPFLYPYQEIIKQKEVRGDLNYKRYVEKEIKEKGEDDDSIKTQYKLEWVIGVGQFITTEQFDALFGDHGIIESSRNPCYAGIDTAKSPDSTVVTIIENHQGNEKRIINWLELRGDNYKDQFDAIWNFISQYDVRAVAIDSTGQGDFMPDMFERETHFTNEESGLYRIKFSLQTKDIIYKNLSVVTRKLLTKLPKCDIMELTKFRQQMLDLQKEYKGGLLSCHHPSAQNAHDDYPDSWALAEYAYHKSQERGEPTVTIF